MTSWLFRKWAGVLVLIFPLCHANNLAAQGTADTIKTSTIIVPAANSVTIFPDTVDKRPRNSYGDLLDDDPRYNPRKSWVIPVLRVTSSNILGWAYDRYIVKADWAKISLQSWKDNLHGRWEWDNDKFGTNFLVHPRAGSDYFNVARSNGYGFWASYPFAFLGSLEWEYFGENTRPSKNDFINTPIS